MDAVRGFLLLNGMVAAMVLRKNEDWHDIGTWASYFQASLLGIYRDRSKSSSSL